MSVIDRPRIGTFVVVVVVVVGDKLRAKLACSTKFARLLAFLDDTRRLPELLVLVLLDDLTGNDDLTAAEERTEAGGDVVDVVVDEEPAPTLDRERPDDDTLV